MLADPRIGSFVIQTDWPYERANAADQIIEIDFDMLVAEASQDKHLWASVLLAHGARSN